MSKGLHITGRPSSPVALNGWRLRHFKTCALELNTTTVLEQRHAMLQASRLLTLCSGLPSPDVNALGKTCSLILRLLARRILILETGFSG